MLITAHPFIISLCKGTRCSLAAHRGSGVLKHSEAMLPGLNFCIPRLSYIQPKCTQQFLPLQVSLSAAPEAQPSPQHYRGRQDRDTELSAPFFLPCALQIHSLHRL